MSNVAVDPVAGRADPARTPGTPAPRSASGAAASSLARGVRLSDVDLLRGLVIVIMALDHVRDFASADGYRFDPLDVAQTTPMLYATRWITHLCAPTFVFLAGVSAWLQASKGKQGAELSRFLATRGLWLVIVEMTVLSFAWSFGTNFLFLQVIWAIGWSMMAMALLVYLPRTWVLALGLAIVLGHNLLDGVKADQFTGPLSLLWSFVHEQRPLLWNGQLVGFLMYPVLPWLGIMAVGYGAGPLFLKPADERDRWLRRIGLAMLAAFLLLRGFDVYGDPSIHRGPTAEVVRSTSAGTEAAADGAAAAQPAANGAAPAAAGPPAPVTWHSQPTATATVMKFMDVQKYPPSLLYALATLGLVFTLYPWIARATGIVRRVLLTFGSVAFFLYVMHVYLVHALAALASWFAGQNVAGFFGGYLTNVFTKPELFKGVGFSLPVVYALWVLALALLYPACAWWGRVKQRRREWWMSYL
jgi:uncharacterized membrane protein